MKRRELLVQLWGLCLSVPAVGLWACGGEEGRAPEEGALEPVTSTSAVVNRHSHELVMDVALLRAPPRGGAGLETSLSEGHVHRVTLTFEQLAALSAGEPVTVVSSVDLGHEHSFRLRRA